MPEDFISTPSNPKNLTPEIKEYLKTTVPIACRDYFISLFLRLNPLIRLEKANDPDSPTTLVETSRLGNYWPNQG